MSRLEVKGMVNNLFIDGCSDDKVCNFSFSISCQDDELHAMENSLWLNRFVPPEEIEAQSATSAGKCLTH